MNDITIAVLLVTYRPDWIKFKRTLHSVITQKNVSFSLVIADDGSENDCFELASEYLKANSFTNYKFIKNKDHGGTVRNILSGLKTISETYVKPISPGDFLYDEHTLSKLVAFLEENPCSACFGDVYSYAVGDFDSITRLRQPLIVWSYMRHDIKWQKRSFFRHCDFINGASLVYKTDRFAYWLSRLSRIIKYTEDTTTLACMISHDEVVRYMPIKNSAFVWYEVGSGISTNGDNRWNSIINSEIRTVYTALCKEKCVPKLYMYMHFSEIRLVRIFLKTLFIPCFLLKEKLTNKFSVIMDNHAYRRTLDTILKDC